MIRNVRVIALAAFAAAPVLYAVDWPQWLGPTRDGRSPETDLLREWPAGGPELLWEVDHLGKGHASLVIKDGRIFTQGQMVADRSFQEHYLLALNASTGEKLWHTGNHKPYRDDYDFGDGPRGTPVVDGNRV